MEFSLYYPDPMAPDIVDAVRRFVDAEVRPAARTLEHADIYPHALVARMQALGLFGALVPSLYGGLGLDVTTYAQIVEALCRGWMSLAGVINSHTMAALIVLHHGTDEQRGRWLPRFASGAARGGLCLTEPHAGSDVQAIRTRARRDGHVYRVDGTKLFVTNGREGNTFALLALTDPGAQPRHRGMSCFIVTKGAPGLTVVKSIGKLGYKGVDTAELLFENFPVPAADLVGGVEGRGFSHIMGALETGRINIAARAAGIAGAAHADARTALGLPEDSGRAEDGGGAAAPATAVSRDTRRTLDAMAARVDAARLITYWAAGMKDRAERCDLEAGMAKLFASETAHEVALDALRLQGARALSGALDAERYYRDTPLMMIGEGTNEIQRTIIARQLLARLGERPGGLVSRDGEPEERRRMLLAVRQFVDKTLGPLAATHDDAGRVPDGVLAALTDLGLFAALAPPAQGGLGLDLTTWSMLLEELARGWAAPAVAVAGHGAVVRALAGPGASARLAALARAEPLAIVVPAPDVTVRRVGDDAIVDGDVPVTHGVGIGGLFALVTRDGVALVPRREAGVTVAANSVTLGLRGHAAAALTVRATRAASDVTIDATALTAVEAVGRAAIGIGLGQAAFEAALRYSQQRSTFGKPICEHQAIQLKLADMATTLTAARLLVVDAARRTAGGEPAVAYRAWTFAADVATRTTLESMRIHGGYGYTTEFPVERYYRDAAALALGGAG